MPTGTEERPRKPLFDPQINLGAVIQVAVVIVGIVLFAAHGERDIALVSQEVKALRESVNQSIQNLTTEMSRLAVATTGVTQLAVRLENGERRLAEAEARNDAQEARVTLLSETLIELRTNMNTILRASQQNLPGQPGRAR